MKRNDEKTTLQIAGVDLFINNGPITNPFQFVYVAAMFLLNPFTAIRSTATQEVHRLSTIIRSTLVLAIDILIVYSAICSLW